MTIGAGLGIVLGFMALWAPILSDHFSERAILAACIILGAYAGLLFALYQFHPDSGNSNY
jgi:hypothetical protein